VVGGVRVLEWPSAPPVTPEMAILQVRGTRQAFLGPTDPYDFARAMGVGERADAKILRDEFFLGPNFSALDGAPADHDSRAIEERLADWLIDARDVVTATGRPVPEPFTIEKAEAVLLKLQNEPTDFWGYPSTKAWVPGEDLGPVREFYSEAVARVSDKRLRPRSITTPSELVAGMLLELHEQLAGQQVLQSLQKQRAHALLVARAVFVGKTFTAWAILAGALYGFGFGVAWVRRGFEYARK